MFRNLMVVISLLTLVADSPAQINESKEYPNVFYSPAAESMPPNFRSVVQLELIVKRGDSDPEMMYADGTVVSQGGWLASVIDAPRPKDGAVLTIESASALMLDGSSAKADVVKYDSSLGLAILRIDGVELRPLSLSEAPLVANRRLSWFAVFRDGPKTYLYSRPLRMYRPRVELGESEGLCEVIDLESSSLTADRSGSALIGRDGTLVAIMGRQPHWNVTPKNTVPRTKTAWAVPAEAIAAALEVVK